LGEMFLSHSTIFEEPFTYCTLLFAHHILVDVSTLLCVLSDCTSLFQYRLFNLFNAQHMYTCDFFTEKMFIFMAFFH